jgi:hypothetical protein
MTDADYHAGVYQQEPADVAGREVYLVDLSRKRDAVAAMISIATKVTLVVSGEKA